MIAPRRQMSGLTARLVRLLVVVLALACQVSAGALADPAPRASAASAMDAVVVFCQASGGKHGTPPAGHRFADPAIAGASHHCAQPAAELAAFAPPPPPRAGRLARLALPQPRAPPFRFASASSARGPPSLI